MKSDVYFIKITGSDPQNISSSLSKLLSEANPFSGYRKGDFIPVKITIGDTQCVHHLKPELVKQVITAIKDKKAKPFLFDTNVIYKGGRSNAIDHLTLAQNKGFSHSKTGAPFIIADGVFGQDGKEHLIDSEYIKKIKLPSFIGMMDNLVVLSHATAHILTGYAGAIKNVAMGMSSKAAKQVQHSSLKPHVTEASCVSCGSCVDICPVNAITISDRKAAETDAKALIDEVKCVGCGECLCACKFNAIFINWKEDVSIFLDRLVNVAALTLSKFKDKFFINFALDITEECDCISTKNEKFICENIGILASKDPVSVDKATLDLINKDRDIILSKKSQPSYKAVFDYAYEKGLGNLDYNLIEL